METLKWYLKEKCTRITVGSGVSGKPRSQVVRRGRNRAESGMGTSLRAGLFPNYQTLPIVRKKKKKWKAQESKRLVDIFLECQSPGGFYPILQGYAPLLLTRLSYFTTRQGLTSTCRKLIAI